MWDLGLLNFSWKTDIGALSNQKFVLLAEGYRIKKYLLCNKFERTNDVPKKPFTIKNRKIQFKKNGRFDEKTEDFIKMYSAEKNIIF